MMHLDLFSGIGGFAYAADQVFGAMTHVFCDNEPFAKAILKKHWPESDIYYDIRIIDEWDREKPFLLTGGFPCQPFSAAGARRGTADDRHLWPEMLRVIQLTEPTWVIAENVRGLLTWNQGIQFEQVCADLEACGYEIQPFIIPAVAVDAPHRRDRVWFVAHATNVTGRRGTPRKDDSAPSEISERNQVREPAVADQIWNTANAYDARGGASRYDAEREGSQKSSEGKDESQRGSGRQGADVADSANGRRKKRLSKREAEENTSDGSEWYGWGEDWAKVAAELCRMDDGLPAELDGLKLSAAGHRKAQLKAYGNAIVPQVAMEIMKAIQFSESVS